MSNPTWQNVLTSVLTRSVVQVSFPKLLEFCESLRHLEHRVNQLGEEVKVLGDSAAEQKTITLIFIDLRLAFLADRPIAKLLRACGIDDPVALSGQNARELHERMERENKKPRRVDSVPPVEQIESWVQAAKLAAEWSASYGQSGAADS